MKPVDRIILGLVILAVAAAAFFAVRRRKRGSSCCGDYPHAAARVPVKKRTARTGKRADKRIGPCYTVNNTAKEEAA